MSNKGAKRRPAAGYAPDTGGAMMMGTVDFENRRAKNRRRNKLARAARKRNRK